MSCTNKGTLILIRIIDLIFSLSIFIMLLPLMLIIIFAIYIDDCGNPIFKQTRIGRYGKPFNIYKFRSMRIGAQKLGGIMIGGRDPRLTKLGYWLRKLKFDEFPQLVNVIKGDMSIVGPRPDVPATAQFYLDKKPIIFSIRPRITDYASIEFSNESVLLGNSYNPQKAYREVIMPQKLELKMKYVENYSVKEYLKLIFITLSKIFADNKAKEETSLDHGTSEALI